MKPVAPDPLIVAVYPIIARVESLGNHRTEWLISQTCELFGAIGLIIQ